MKFFHFVLFLFFSLALTAQEIYDDCNNAVFINNPGTYCSGVDEFNNINATTSSTPDYGLASCWSDAENDVWFYFQADPAFLDLVITVNGSTMSMPEIAIYRGDCTGFAELSCNQAAVNETSTSLTLLGLDPLEFYYIRINDYSATAASNEGTFQLCIEEYVPDINMENGSTTACSGTIYDSGGPGGNYMDGENLTYTICPTDVHDCIVLNVGQYDIEQGFDNLYVYDGPTAAAPLIGQVSGFGNGYVAAATSGCMTLVFQSDGIINNPGFEATWECVINNCPVNTPIAVDVNVNGQDLVESIVADGTQITNVSLNCGNGAYGTFTAPPGNTIQMESGIILSSGSATDAAGPNTAGGTSTSTGAVGDSDLEILSNVQTFDVCILEFDVYAETNLLSFDYLFASEEYDEYACANVNDVFGFFISGPGINGPFQNMAINMAIIPGTNIPVSINTVNSGSVGAFGTLTNCSPPNGSLDYSDYYMANPEGPSSIEYDGFTADFTSGDMVLLSASATVTPCQWYHLKLAIADGGDSVFDSGVFIEGSSLSASVGEVEASYEPGGISTTYAVENCITGFLDFTIEEPLPNDLILYYDIDGTATNGIDYVTIPDSIIIPAGQTTTQLPIIPIADGNTEGTELIAIYLHFPCDPTNPYDTAWVIIEDEIPNDFNVPTTLYDICPGDMAQLEATGATSYSWTPAGSLDDPASPTPIATPTVSTTYQLVAQTVCGYDTTYVDVNVYSLDIGPDHTICDTEVVPLSPIETFTTAAYNWSPAIGLSCTDCPDPVFTPPNAGTYTFQLNMVAGSCNESDEITIIVEPTPILEVAPDTDFCLGDAINLGSDNNLDEFTYVWFPSAFLSCSDCPNPVATPDQDITYQVIAYSDNCGNDTATVSLQITTLELGADASICDNQTYQFDIQTAGQPATLYSWSPTTGLSCTDCPNPLVTPVSTGATTYELTMTTADCVLTDQLTVDVEPGPYVTLVPDQTICIGSSITLGDPSNPDEFTYDWSPSETLDCFPDCDTPNPTATPDSDITYTVTVSTDNCGSITSSVTIEISTLDIGEDISICEGDVHQFNIGTTGDPAIGYNWYPTEGLACTDCPNPSASPSTTTTYYLEMELPTCTLIDSATVFVTNLPAESAVEDTIICSGSSLFLGVNQFTGINYEWTPSTGLDDPNVWNPEATPDETTTYYVTAFANGCVFNDSVTVTVLSDFDLIINNNDTTIFQGDVVDLTTTLTPFTTNPLGNVEYEWTPTDGLSNNNTPDVMAQPLEDITYTIVAISEAGCESEDDITIEVIPPNFGIPNAFSPNGDDKNDFFRVVINGNIVVREFKVFDRWGQLVFDNEDSNGWDGTFKGTDLPNDVYVYVIQIEKPDGEQITFSGDVTLIR